MINVVPSPGAVSTSIVPPIMSTMFFVIDMPSPVPCIPLTVEVRSRVNISKTVAANSFVMPIPLSFTRSS